jgi:hypothetical protein
MEYSSSIRIEYYDTCNGKDVNTETQSMKPAT